MTTISTKPREIINNPMPIKCGDWLLLNHAHLCIIAKVGRNQYQLFHITKEGCNRWTECSIESNTGDTAFSEAEIKVLTSGLRYEKVEVELIITLPPRYK